MKIRAKIVSVILPVIIVSIVLVGINSYLLASAGINRLAHEFLGFKVAELEKYSVSQYQMLIDNNIADSPEYIQATHGSIEVYASSIIRSDSEIILAFDESGSPQMYTSRVQINSREKQKLAEIFAERPTGLIEPNLDGITYVAKGFYFEPFDWYIMAAEQRDVFFQDTQQIALRTIYLLAGALLIGTLLIIFFASRITKPLNTIVGTMKEIITSNDLSKQVAVEYKDETGTLAHTFNIMVGELDKAYREIIHFARDAAIAEQKEKKVRQIFQKYVPQELIDRFFAHPESMLVGDEREVSILFSDIRSFTTISENMQPSDLVNQLNSYFGIMVEIITNRDGIVDKYIGDAIMAIFGAPVRHENDAMQSLMAGLEMSEAVDAFNVKQAEMGRPAFRTGIGINYGVVTVGNIGAEKKMDYTVIGDTVNLASRLEGLTKEYQQQLIISESLQELVADEVPTRLLDTVAVKGKARGINIYTAKRSIDEPTAKAWEQHHKAMDAYYARDFDQAIRMFKSVLHILPEDFTAKSMIERCEDFKQTPPPADWTGVKIMKTK
ncbi:MAG: adenylate/guanylate cyclase domain-containing protein [Spirochaetaceae bacterium]|nr:MAG: adenylate/guanylate cyclase domain-containing protein [Spirochaetaceae bacterium]